MAFLLLVEGAMLVYALAAATVALRCKHGTLTRRFQFVIVASHSVVFLAAVTVTSLAGCYAAVPDLLSTCHRKVSAVRQFYAFGLLTAALLETERVHRRILGLLPEC